MEGDVLKLKPGNRGTRKFRNNFVNEVALELAEKNGYVVPQMITDEVKARTGITIEGTYGRQVISRLEKMGKLKMNGKRSKDKLGRRTIAQFVLVKGASKELPQKKMGRPVGARNNPTVTLTRAILKNQIEVNERLSEASKILFPGGIPVSDLIVWLDFTKGIMNGER